MESGVEGWRGVEKGAQEMNLQRKETGDGEKERGGGGVERVKEGGGREEGEAGGRRGEV